MMRRKASRIPSDSESNDSGREKNDTGETPQKLSTPLVLKTPIVRSSERIRVSRKRRLRIPTKGEMFDNIPSAASPRTSLRDKYSPKKLVNNFMKETHQYNRDPNLTASESSNESFINDDDTSSKESDDDQNKAKSFASDIETKSELSDASGACADSSETELNSVCDEREPVSAAPDDDNTEEPLNVSRTHHKLTIESDIEKSSSDEDAAINRSSSSKRMSRHKAELDDTPDASCDDNFESVYDNDDDDSVEIAGADNSFSRGLWKIIPSTIDQILRAQHTSTGFISDGRLLDRVTFVGIIRSSSMSSDHLVYTIDDLTGPMLDVFLRNPQPMTVRLATQAADGAYVRVVGRLGISDDSAMRFLGLRVAPLTDPNELTTHLLELIHLRLLRKKEQERAERAIALCSPGVGNNESMHVLSSVVDSEGSSVSCTVSDTSDTSSDGSVEGDEGTKRPSKRVKHMKRKREKRFVAFTKLKEKRDRRHSRCDESLKKVRDDTAGGHLRE